MEIAITVLKWVFKTIIVVVLYVVLFAMSVLEVVSRHISLLIKNYLQVGQRNQNNQPQSRGANTPYGGLF